MDSRPWADFRLHIARVPASNRDKSISLTSGTHKKWNKSWKEGMLVKIKVCARYKDGNHRFCSKYRYVRA